jgi:hypothetical protein
MSKDTKLSIAKAVASQLHITEEAIDTAMAESAQLIETYISSRRAVRMSTLLGQDVYKHTLKAMEALSEAQAHMGAAHKGLTEVQAQVGISTTAMTNIVKKPSMMPATSFSEDSIEA